MIPADKPIGGQTEGRPPTDRKTDMTFVAYAKAPEYHGVINYHSDRNSKLTPFEGKLEKYDVSQLLPS